jgi:hypothetical protein
MKGKGIFQQIHDKRRYVFNRPKGITLEDLEVARKYLGFPLNYGPHPLFEYYPNPYRIPTFEEMREGMEVEILTSYGWIKDTWPQVLSADTHVNLFGGDTLLSKFKYADLRIKK